MKDGRYAKQTRKRRRKYAVAEPPPDDEKNLRVDRRYRRRKSQNLTRRVLAGADYEDEQ